MRVLHRGGECLPFLVAVRNADRFQQEENDAALVAPVGARPAHDERDAARGTGSRSTIRRNGWTTAPFTASESATRRTCRTPPRHGKCRCPSSADALGGRSLRVQARPLILMPRPQEMRAVARLRPLGHGRRSCTRADTHTQLEPSVRARYSGAVRRRPRPPHSRPHPKPPAEERPEPSRETCDNSHRSVSVTPARRRVGALRPLLSDSQKRLLPTRGRVLENHNVAQCLIRRRALGGSSSPR